MEEKVGWSKATIKELISRDGCFCDGDWIEKKDQNPNGKVRLIQLADIGDGLFKNKSDRFLTFERAKEINCTFLEEGDIIVARMPEPIGRCCIFPLKGTGKHVTAVDVAIIRFGNKFIFPKYFLYILNSPQSRNYIEALQSGTTRKRISRINLATIEFPIAPLPEQHAIVSKLEQLFSELDNGITNLKLAQGQLKVYRQTVLKKAFEGELTRKWRDQQAKLPTAEELIEEIQRKRRKASRSPSKKIKVVKSINEAELATLLELPEGWMWVKVDELCDVVRGGSPRPAGDPTYYGGEIPFLKVADLTHNDDVYLNGYKYTIKEAGLKKTRYVERNTLLLSNSGATLGVPKICSFKTTFNDGIAAFLDLIEESLLFHYYFWLSKTKELRTINQGAAQPNLNTDIIANYPFPLCSLPEQQAIVQQIETRLSVCDKLEQDVVENLEKAEALRQSILKRAFEGKLLNERELEEVRSAPGWAPAEVLLERINAEKATAK
ncbi:MAG: restriction endonuclease subunit S [Methanolobus sp.]|uniref:restriction endonuclease subunit S n=1 Tax=Methanolobus sp. TaxID=1874737 RepID=UPI00272FEBA3|nr:restriction endonuclease subunit S [Methanolobus sp.]MDP2218137.1 restriction endonuclease subunit S [Methanolobus sp.]